MEEKRSSGAGIVAALLMLLLLLPVGAYVGGYFLRSEAYSKGFLTVRHYPTAWEARFFKPAARIESLLTGKQVYIQQRGIILIDST